MSKPKTYNYDLPAFTFMITLLLTSSSLFSPNLPVVLGSSSSSTSNFHRVDPYQHLKYYNGGYDLRNKHYWASAAFTGIHGYAVAGALLVGGLGWGVLLITKIVISSSNDSSTTRTNYSEFSYHLMFFLILLFSILALIAIGFTIAENQKTLQRTNKLKYTVFGAGTIARRTIHRVNKVLHNIQDLLCPYDQSTCNLLNTTSLQLGKESLTIKQFMGKNGHPIDQATWAAYITNLVIVSVNLSFLVVGIVLLLLHWHPGFIILIFVCWILTMACWVLTGVDFFVNTFAEDTCTALQEFTNNPLNSSLSSLLPCADALKQQTIVVQLGQTVHDFITELNSNMINMPKEIGLNDAYYDNVIGDKKICDPFGGPPDYEYLAGKCPKHAIPIRDLPDILSRFTCEDDISSDSCRGSGRFIPKTTYLMADAYIRSVQDLINIYPDLESLIHCSFVKDQISEVVMHQCKPFKFTTRILWVSVLCLSISMIVLLSLWVAKACQDQGKVFSRCSILPRHEGP